MSPQRSRRGSDAKNEHAGPARSRRAFWPLWGSAAGVLGLVAHVVMQPTLTGAQRQAGAEVLAAADRSLYHVGAVTGFLAIGCLLTVAAAWWRWAEHAAPSNLMARVVPLTLTASAGAMVLAYGFKGSLAIYLPGGVNASEFPNEGLYTLFMIDDLGAFMAWWGVALAAGAVAWLSLHDRLFPRWIGGVSGLTFLAAVGFLAVTGLTGFSGIVGPLWMVIAGVGLAFGRWSRDWQYR